MSYVSRLSGIPAVIAFVALAVVGMLLAGWPFLRRVAWVAAAAVGVLAAINEFRR